MGESPPAELPANDTSSTEQFIVIFQDFISVVSSSALGLVIAATSTVTQSHIRTSRSFFAPYTSKHMRHSPSGEHPYLAVRFRGNLTRRYRRRSLTSCQRTINMPQPSHITVINILTPIIPIFTDLFPWNLLFGSLKSYLGLRSELCD